MALKSELRPVSPADFDELDSQPASQGEAAESERGKTPPLGMQVVLEAVEARDKLALAENPAQRQMIFAANHQRWQAIADYFRNDKQKRHDGELTAGSSNLKFGDIFAAEVMDRLSIDFAVGMGELWLEGARRDAVANNYSPDYCSKAQAIDWGGGGAEPPDEYRDTQMLGIYSRFIVTQSGQYYAIGNPDLGPGSSHSEILPRLPDDGSGFDFDKLRQHLLDQHAAMEGWRDEFRETLQSKGGVSSPEAWSCFGPMAKGFLKHLSEVYEKAHGNLSEAKMNQALELSRRAIEDSLGADQNQEGAYEK